MEITEVKVYPVSEEKLRAFVSLVFDGCFMINDVKVIMGRDGVLFISMPSRRKKNGEFKDIAHPINNECRRLIETRVLGEYERVLSGRVPAAVGDEHPATPPMPARPEPAAPRPSTLEEVEEYHLRDSFWSIS